MRGYRCSAATSICSTLGSPRQAPAETLYQTLAKGHESVAVADPGSSKFYVVMGVGVGDTPHLTAPVYLVRRSNQSAVKPALKTGPQVQLALQGALALIGAEYSGADALLVDLEAGAATALSGRGSFGAVWVPVPASPKTRKGSVAIGPQR